MTSRPVSGHLADHGGPDIPLGADGEELVHPAGLDDRHHAFLRLAHQDLGRPQRRVPQRHRVQPDPHAAGARRGELGGRAGDPGRAEVLEAGHQAAREELEAALDQQLLQERIPHLHAGALRGVAARRAVAERRAGQHRGPAHAIGPGGRPEQDHRVARPAGRRDLEVAVSHDSHAERVDQRIARVARVEVEFPADVGQAQAVPVEGDAADHAGEHPAGVGGVGRAETQRVHHPDRPRAHGEDVADDAADAGGRALVRLHVRRVVVRFDLEGDRVALADVDHPGVVADAGEERAGRRRPWPRTAAGAPWRTCRSSARST